MRPGLAILASILAGLLLGGSAVAQDVFFGPGQNGLFGGFYRPAAASVFVSDTFTGTDGTTLASHTGETGATWTKNAATTSGNGTISSNRLYAATAVPGGYYASGTPSDADYTVVSTYNIVTRVAGYTMGTTARYSTSADSGYVCALNYVSAGTGNLLLLSYAAGTPTTLATSTSFTFTLGATEVITFGLSGTSLSCSRAGGANPANATDSTYSAAGRVGVRANVVASPTIGVQLDSLEATN